MVIDKKTFFSHLIAIAVGIVLGLIVIYCTRKPVEPVKIERDTVTVHDTVPDYHPVPNDSALVKWMVVRVPVAAPQSGAIQQQADTVYLAAHDTIEAVLPVMQMHYKTEDYQAWVSGYKPSLDSIEVYKKTEYITERITVSKPPNRFTIGLQAGYGYGFKSKQLEPYVGLGIGYRF